MGAWGRDDLCYKLFFEAGTQGTVLASTAGVVLDANPEACAILGYGREELRGGWLRSLIDASDPDTEEAFGKRRLGPARNLRLRLLRRDGSRVSVEASLVRSADGGDANMLGIFFRRCGEVEAKTEAAVEKAEGPPRRGGGDQALGWGEERFRALMENAQDFVVLADENNVALYASPAVERVLGYAPEEFVGTVIADYVHPDDLQLTLQKVAETLPVPGPHNMGTIRYRRKDGSDVHLEVVVNNRLDDPVLRGVVCNCRDVTERVRQREELEHFHEELEQRVESRTAQLAAAMEEAETSERMMRLTEERWRTLVRHSADLTVVLTADGTISYESPAVERILGFRPEERVGTNAFDHLHPDDVESVRGKFAELLGKSDERVSIEYRVADREATWHHFEAIGVNLLAKPPIDGIVVNARDITERKRTERALRQSEQRFRSSFYHAAIGMGLVGIDGRWLQVNRALCRIVGYTEEELLAKTYQDLTHPEDLEADRDLTLKMFSGEIETCQVEKRYLHKEGRVVWISLSGSLVRDPEGEPSYFISQIQDITDRRRAEEALKKSEAGPAEAQRIAHVGSWEWDLRTDELCWSDEIFRICGLASQADPPSLEGSWRLVHTEDRDLVVNAIEDTLQGGTPRGVEHRLVRPDGEVRWVHRRNEVVLRGKGGSR